MIDRIKQLFVNYLNLGVSQDKSQEINQQIFVSNLFSTIGYSITLLMAVSATVRGNYVLAGSLFVASALFFFAYWINRFAAVTNVHKISTRVVLVSLMSLMVYLVYTGGHQGTGPLWIYIVPPVAFFFGGMRRGLSHIGIFVIVISVMLFYPNHQLVAIDYSFEFKSRLIYSFLTVTLLFGFYEFSRQQTYRSIRELSQKFEQQAMHDPLTHLANRRGMKEHLDYEYNRSLRSKLDMSVMLCDIDHFKSINDRFGHDAGDHVLEQLSKLFTDTLRKQDIVARWGGEEFLFLLPETNGFEAFTLAEKIRKRVELHTFEFKGRSIRFTLSMGIKEVTHDISIDKAISLADHFLYQAKDKGRNLTMPEKSTL